MSDTKKVCLGVFVGAHGVKGHAKVKTFTEDPRNIVDYGPVASENNGTRFTLKLVRVLKGDVVLVTSPQIQSREHAIALSGTKLFVDKEMLPEIDEEDAFYLDDLVGLQVVTDDGTKIGIVSAIFDFGAGDILEIKDIPGFKAPQMVPFTKEAIPNVDLNKGILTIAQDFVPVVDTEERPPKRKKRPRPPKTAPAKD